MRPNEGTPQCLVQPKEVYYTSQLGVGKAVSVVSFTRPTPHFVSYYETREGRIPLSQSFEDIKFMVEDATKRMGVSQSSQV
jgi:hypothetical protein